MLSPIIGGNLVYVSKYYPELEGQKRKDTIVIDFSDKEEEKYDYIAGLLESHKSIGDICNNNEYPR